MHIHVYFRMLRQFLAENLCFSFHMMLVTAECHSCGVGSNAVKTGTVYWH